MIVFGYFLPAGKNFASHVLTSERWIDRFSPIYCRFCWRIWAIVIHSSRRPASAQKVKVVPGLHAGRVEELLRLLEVEVVRLQLLVVDGARRADQRVAE